MAVSYVNAEENAKTDDIVRLSRGLRLDCSTDRELVDKTQDPGRAEG